VNDKVRGKKRRGVCYRLHRGIVRRYVKQPLVAGAREVGEQERQEALCRAGERERRRCRRDGGEYIGGGVRHGSGI